MSGEQEFFDISKTSHTRGRIGFVSQKTVHHAPYLAHDQDRGRVEDWLPSISTWRTKLLAGRLMLKLASRLTLRGHPIREKLDKLHKVAQSPPARQPARIPSQPNKPNGLQGIGFDSQTARRSRPLTNLHKYDFSHSRAFVAPIWLCSVDRPVAQSCLKAGWC